MQSVHFSISKLSNTIDFAVIIGINETRTVYWCYSHKISQAISLKNYLKESTIYFNHCNSSIIGKITWNELTNVRMQSGKAISRDAGTVIGRGGGVKR